MKYAAIHPLFAETLDRHFHLPVPVLAEPRCGLVSNDTGVKRLSTATGDARDHAIRATDTGEARESIRSDALDERHSRGGQFILAFILMAVLEENAILKRRLESIGAAEQEMELSR